MMRPVRLAIATVAAAMLLLAAACGGTEQQQPSAENFCTTLTQNADELRGATDQLRTLADSSGASRSISELASAAKSFIDMSNLYDDLAQVAPPQVKADAEAVKATFDNLATDVDTSQLAASAREALAELRNSGELQRLNDYAKNECGVQIG